MEPSRPLESFSYRRVFPWLALFRAFWIAVDLRKMTLAGIALLLVSSGSWLWDQAFAAPGSEGDEAGLATRWPWQQSLGYELHNPEEPLAELNDGLRDPWNTLTRIGRNWQIALRPVADVADPIVQLMQGRTSWTARGHGTAQLLWGLMVWAVFGGVIGRMAAVQFARDQQLGLWSGLRFSSRYFFSYLYAPLLPLLGMAILWLVCLSIGLLGRLPGGGPSIAGALWVIGLASGFLMTVILIGVTAGWPIMFATINCEATDGFDALSRAFHYVLERPLHYFGYAVVSIAFGAFAIFFVWLVAHLIVYLTALSVASGMGWDPSLQLLVDGPALVMPKLAPESVDDPTVGRMLVGIWTRGVAVLVMGFVYSFFWTSTTIIYLLLRRSADGKELDEIQMLSEARRDVLASYAPQPATPEPPLAPKQDGAVRIDLAP